MIFLMVADVGKLNQPYTYIFLNRYGHKSNIDKRQNEKKHFVLTFTVDRKHIEGIVFHVNNNQKNTENKINVIIYP